MTIKAIILIKIYAGEVEDAFCLIKRLRAADEVYMTFGPYDVVAVIQANDLSEIGRIVANEIQPIPGVTETLTCITIENWRCQESTGGVYEEVRTHMACP
jgi:DNA-binding Lrp family transcriptional regulator